jgi:hypothetical protein
LDFAALFLGIGTKTSIELSESDISMTCGSGSKSSFSSELSIIRRRETYKRFPDLFGFKGQTVGVLPIYFMSSHRLKIGDVRTSLEVVEYELFPSH